MEEKYRKLAVTKCLLYCTKAIKHYRVGHLIFNYDDLTLNPDTNKYVYGNSCYLMACENSYGKDNFLNGKIVAECEVETKKVKKLSLAERRNGFLRFENEEEILKQSCLNELQLRTYLINDEGYALQIKNLKRIMLSFNKDCIFKKPHGNEVITRAPQNMQWCFDRKGNRYALISIRPEWLCKILNGEKTIEIRKKVLKEMVEDEKIN